MRSIIFQADGVYSDGAKRCDFAGKYAGGPAYQRGKEHPIGVLAITTASYNEKNRCLVQGHAQMSSLSNSLTNHHNSTLVNRKF